MKVKLLEGTKCPKQGREGDAGYDFFLREDVTLKAHTQCSIDTGVACKLPNNHAGLFALRSSICLKEENLILKNPLVDENYIGELHLILLNSGDTDIKFLKGDRIASLYVFPVYHDQLEIVTELESTNRGGNWNGSSGK